jgi:hypothetical protein
LKRVFLSVFLEEFKLLEDFLILPVDGGCGG